MLLLLGAGGVRTSAQGKDLYSETRIVHVGSHRLPCRIVIVPVASGRVVPRVITANGGVGKTEEFASMIKRTHALAAINGSFFDAYNRDGMDKDPSMTLISGGQVLHKGMTGTVIGFGSRGVVMGRLELPISGIVTIPGRRPASWYAYWINRTPTSADNITLFTPARGARCRVSDGVSVVVEDNLVARVEKGDVAIPPKGYVIHFRGDQVNEAAKFPIGATVSLQVKRKVEQDEAAWDAVTEAVGAGPRLVRDGQIAYDPQSEGFHSEKILSAAGARSAIGLTKNGEILLVTTGGATVRELADVMKNLGAVQAMNLDGGASSGLYANGVLLTPPGRPLSNALIFVRP